MIKTAPLNLRLSSQLLTGLMVLGAASLTGCVTPGSPISGGGGNLSPEERRLQDAENALVIVKRRLDGIDSALSDSGGNLAGEVRDLRGGPVSRGGGTTRLSHGSRRWRGGGVALAGTPSPRRRRGGATARRCHGRESNVRR